MWKIYAGHNEGIAIKTDFASLAASFIGDEPIYIGEVTYIDYNVDVIPDELVLQALLYKRNHFEHEREVRVVKEPKDQSNLPAKGEYSPVDLSLLIQDVIVSPLSPDWFTALVQSVANKYALQVNVKPSAFTTPPAKG